MKTTMFLIRHGATSSNLERPPRLQGRRIDQPLAPIGERQAELTRDFLGVTDIDAMFTSPLQRAQQTASIIAKPHRMSPLLIDGLTECDVGTWENKSWPQIEREFPEQYTSFMDDPAQHGYPGGETFKDVHNRAHSVFTELLAEHEGQTILVVSHHVVLRTYLAGLMGIPAERARIVSLNNCSISMVVESSKSTKVKTLNSTFHLNGVAAA